MVIGYVIGASVSEPHMYTTYGGFQRLYVFLYILCPS